MKNRIIFILLFSASLGVYSQNQNEFIRDDELYSKVLYKYICNNLNMYIDDKIFVEYNLITTIGIPKSICGKTIEIINIDKSSFRGKNKTFSFIRIVPLRFRDEKFIISIIDFRASKSKNIIKLINKGGQEYELLYDCDTHKIRIIE
jgi:hypothetical protein